MARVSLSMIVKDEAESIAAVLADASAFCDELVVADTGSTDGTPELAAAAGAVVLHVPWTDDFAAARNASLDACTGDWVVWLDADDRVPPAAQQAFRRVLADLDGDGADGDGADGSGADGDGVDGDRFDALISPYHCGFDEHTGAPTFTTLRERVLRRSARLRWAGAIHEVVDITGVRTREEAQLVVEHRRTASQAAQDEGRNLRILEKLYAEGDRSPRTLYYRANELRDVERHQEAADAYAEVLALPQPAWERYFALMSRAECLQAIGRTGEAAETAVQAVLLDPTRPEAWMVAGMIPYEQGEWARAVPFFSAASVAQARPTEGFVRGRDHDWAPWDFLSVCLGNSGRHEEALQAGVRALRGNPQGDRVRANLGWFVSELSVTDSTN
ncbi:glycosyltransferase [Streptacidiphilus fuscans]|uniref:Glycosyltransferase n=1 Tax=Streptacidiphilus fuscans TaxID=2789292 RepID=A0A931B363_9ACTN|nr:glycosyltransferase [Streptacidiphilus fuscans]MBF9070360.1 glycosyltransferase [Streptacidiphilus fuscans]